MTIADIDAEVTFNTNADTTVFTAADRLIKYNKYGRQIHNWILSSMDEVDYDDKNNTSDFPILTTDLEANQQDYSLPDGTTKIKRIEVTYDGTNWVKANPIDIDEITDPTDTSSIANDFSTDAPFYDINSNSVFMYPIPSTQVIGGIKIWIDRKANPFTSADVSTGTKEPGFDEDFHSLIPTLVTWDWEFYKLKDYAAADRTLQIASIGESKLKKHYSSKQKDRRYAMGASDVDYS